MEMSKVTDHGARISVLLSKLQRQIGHSLRHTLHCHCLIVSEPVVLRRNTYTGYMWVELKVSELLILQHGQHPYLCFHSCFVN